MSLLHASTLRSLWGLFLKNDAEELAQRLTQLALEGHRALLATFADHPLADDWHDFAAQALTDFFEKRRGTVYVVTNPVHEGLYKVGHTGGALSARLKSLNSAGVVGSFVVVDHVEALDRFAVEKMAHRELALVAQQHKEFFKADFPTVSQAVRAAAASYEQCMRSAALLVGSPCPE